MCLIGLGVLSYAFAVDAADQWVSQIDDDASHRWGQCRAIYFERILQSSMGVFRI